VSFIHKPGKGLRSERALLLAISEMYVQGVSTRRIKKIVEELFNSEDLDW